MVHYSFFVVFHQCVDVAQAEVGLIDENETLLQPIIYANQLTNSLLIKHVLNIVTNKRSRFL